MVDTGTIMFENECPIVMKWRIKEEILRDAIDRKVKLYSEEVNASKIPGVKYCLSIHFNPQYQDFVYVYLTLRFEMARNITSKYTVSIKSALYKSLPRTDVYLESKTWGYRLCTYAELFDPEKKFLVDGIMEIELEGNLKAQCVKRKVSQSLSLAQLLSVKDDEKDIAIVVKDQQIKIHKLILCAKSNVFKAELESGWKESKEKKIEITDFSFKVVEIVVKYLYENDFKHLLTESFAIDLLRFADKYDVKHLHDLIQTFLLEKLTEENVVEFANASVTFDAAELREFCICFLMTFAGKNIAVKDAKQLNDEILAEIGRRSLFSTV